MLTNTHYYEHTKTNYSDVYQPVSHFPSSLRLNWKKKGTVLIARNCDYNPNRIKSFATLYLGVPLAEYIVSKYFEVSLTPIP